MAQAGDSAGEVGDGWMVLHQIPGRDVMGGVDGGLQGVSLCWIQQQ